jgi:hypothetical protein
MTGSIDTYRDVPCPFLPHEIGKRPWKQSKVAKLPHAQLQFTATLLK